MTPSRSHADLVNDALAVFDLLDAQGEARARASDRKAQLVRLVTEVCERDGRPYDRASIEKAVEVRLEATPVPTLVSSDGLRPRWSRWGESVSDLCTRFARRCRQAFQLSPLVKFWALSGVVSVAAAALLVFAPWVAIAQAPFQLAAHHVVLYSFALLTAIGVSIAGIVLGTREENINVSMGSAMALIVLALGGGMGGLFAYGGAQSTLGLSNFQDNLKVINNALVAAHHQLKPSASADDVVASANAAIMKDRSTRLRDVGTFDSDTGIIQNREDLNPIECQALPLHLNPKFHVVSVNGEPVHGATLSCPFTWNNEVVVEAHVADF